MKNNRKNNAPCLAIFGTGSDVGKSMVTTALCRVCAWRGIRVAPYKAQNMSNNSGVTPEGLEMGRAQIVQAEAAGIAPHVDMNPILLKPTAGLGPQVILLGRVAEGLSPAAGPSRKDDLFGAASTALDRLRNLWDLVLLEGAGSCAEVNLMDTDLVNLPMARYAEAPVILVADIDRGGVFAQIIGTLACLPPGQRDAIKGFVINRFRGDIRLFREGVDWIEKKTGKPVFGVLPWFDHITIEPEDSVVIESPRRAVLSGDRTPAMAVIRLPHISNFNDFNPLSALSGIDVHFLEKVQRLDPFRAVVLPGSKNTRYDLAWLRATGWDREIASFAENGGNLLGICGGYQMMGNSVYDPNGLEGAPGKTEGLHLLPVETELTAPKVTTLTRFSWHGAAGSGYEIHMGRTTRKKGTALFRIDDRNGLAGEDTDGCQVNGGRIMGTYIHGLFDNPDILAQWLETIGLGNVAVPKRSGIATRTRQYDLLAEHFAAHVDVDAILDLIPS